MSREQLLELANDVDRLLAAGSTLAIGDEGLRKREKLVSDLAPKVPALVPVAEAVKQVTAAKPGQSASRLLDLLLFTQQLRFSLPPPKVEGNLQHLSPAGSWKSAAATRDVRALNDALRGEGVGRLEVVKDAIRRGIASDLRVVENLLNALADGYDELANLVADEALPAFGPAIVPDLKCHLNLKGKVADARRLRALAKIDPQEALPLCRQALAEGSTPLRVQALKCLTLLDPAEAEKHALTLQDKLSADLRCAALEALRSSRDDRALETMVTALTAKEYVVSQTASEILAQLPHPKTATRLIQELENRLAQRDELKASKGKKAPSPTKGKKQAKPGQAKKDLELLTQEMCLVVATLGQREASDGVKAILPLLKHPEADLREAAVNALTATENQEGLKAAAGLIDDPKVWRAATRAAWKLPPKERYDLLAPAVETVSDVKKGRRERGKYIVDDLFTEESASKNPRTDWDQRWGKLLLKHLEGPHRSDVALALAVVQGEKAIPHLMRVLVPSVKKGECGAVEGLGFVRARSAIKAMIELLPGQRVHHYCIHDALRRTGDKFAIPLLEKILEKVKDSYRQRQIERVIEDLHKQPN